MSCLFDSLSKFTNHSSQDLRAHIVSYLQTNPKLMDDTTFQELMKWEETDSGSYINEMSGENTWGGAIEIKAFVNLFKVNVNVHIPMIQRIVDFKYEPDCDRFVNILWTGNHYVSLGV